jgi:hypothetical protein
LAGDVLRRARDHAELAGLESQGFAAAHERRRGPLLRPTRIPCPARPGARIAQLRKQQGITQVQLAETLGV